MNHRYKTLKQVVREHIVDRIGGGKTEIKGDIKIVPYSSIVLINPGRKNERPIKFENIPAVGRELRELCKMEIRETELSQ